MGDWAHAMFKMDEDFNEDENDVELERADEAREQAGFCPLATWNAERPHCGLDKDPSFSCQLQASRRVYTTDGQGSSLPPQAPSLMQHFGRPRDGGGAFLGIPPKRQRTALAGVPVPGFAGAGFGRVPSPLAASCFGLSPQARAPSPFAQHGSPCNSTPSPGGHLASASPHMGGLSGSGSLSPLKYMPRVALRLSPFF